MGFRFRKSIKLIPGIRINLSKSGASISLGGRGITTNISRRGIRTTLNIPGTGISYIFDEKHRKASKSISSPAPFQSVQGQTYNQQQPRKPSFKSFSEGASLLHSKQLQLDTQAQQKFQGGIRKEIISNPLSCPSCRYERIASDSAPLWQCPNCELIFSKETETPDAKPASPTNHYLTIVIVLTAITALFWATM